VFLETALNSQRVGLEGTVERQVSRSHQFLAGVTVERESTFNLDARSNLDFRTLEPSDTIEPLPGVVPKEERTIFGAYFQDSWAPASRVSVTGGLRFDHLSDIAKAEVDPRLSLVVRLPRHFSVKLLYGRAFRAPSFRELYFNLPNLQGNPELKPVTAQTLEAALSFSSSGFDVSATPFLTLLRDPIITEGRFSFTSYQRLVNGPDVNIRGLEFELKRRLNGSASVFVSYTHQNPEDAQTGARVPDTPRNLASLGATVVVDEHISLTPTFSLKDARTRAPGDPRPEIPGHALVNLTVRAHKIYKTLEVTGIVRNLFGRDYVDPSPFGGLPGDYPRPGRSALVLASYKF
jgi:outer membrane receptor protein involved in Fe transport